MNADKNLDLESKLKQILSKSPLFQNFVTVAHEIKLKNWYVAGGCVTQSVWNSQMGLDPWHGLKDADVMYFDSEQTEAEQKNSQKQIYSLFGDLKIPVDLKNQALVHKWYTQKFGYSIPAYQCTEDGIRTWLPAFAVGVRPSPHGFVIFAPYGLEDLFAMTLRPNKLQITKAIYTEMAHKFQARWPEITILPWA